MGSDSSRKQRGKRFLGDTRKVRAFRGEAADKAIGIFVATASRGAAGMGRVFSKLGIEMFDTTTFKFAVDGDAMTGEEEAI